MSTYSYRKRDTEVERIISEYLDKNLYSQSQFNKKARVNSREEQLLGSDIIITLPALDLNETIVDEKAATHYMKKPLPTFSLELSFISARKEEIEGWFTDENKKTQYYLFMWPYAKNDWEITYDDIIHIDYALVKRADIFTWLEGQGYSIDRLRAKARFIRNNVFEGGAIDKVSGKDFYFYLTTRLKEQPINLIIRRKVYEELAVLKGRV